MNQRILSEVYGRPWLITPQGHHAIQRLVEQHSNGEPVAFLDDFMPERRENYTDRDGIAHVHMDGVLGRRLSAIEKSCGACDYDDLAQAITDASSARGLLLHIDSPGGMVSGNREVADAFAAYDKPKVVHAEGLAASAAYLIAAAGDMIVASPSASIGSIGVIIPWVDSEGLWESAGIAYNPIIATGADLKGAGFGPTLSDEQREHMQDEVDQIAADFRAHVLAYRDVDDEVFRAGTYFGETAIDLGLIDAIGSAEDARQLLLAVLG